MTQYIGVKAITAEPAFELEGKVYPKSGLCPKAINRRDGYKIIYEDGYESWSPKEVFEKAYRPTTGLTFGLALEALKADKHIKLPFWGDDVFISLQSPTPLSKMTHTYLYVTSRHGLVPWNPTQVEVLSEDWQIID